MFFRICYCSFSLCNSSDLNDSKQWILMFILITMYMTWNVTIYRANKDWWRRLFVWLDCKMMSVDVKEYEARHVGSDPCLTLTIAQLISWCSHLLRVRNTTKVDTSRQQLNSLASSFNFLKVLSGFSLPVLTRRHRRGVSHSQGHNSNFPMQLELWNVLNTTIEVLVKFLHFLLPNRSI